MVAKEGEMVLNREMFSKEISVVKRGAREAYEVSLVSGGLSFSISQRWR